MRRIAITASHGYELQEAPTPAIGAGELLIAPLRVGICATDLELLDGSMVYLRQGLATYPVLPGHEWVGVVIRSGADTSGFVRGDLVVGECSVGCGLCRTCLGGDYHRCPRRTETGIMGRAGGMAEFIAYPAGSAHVVPAHVALRDAALIEPTAVAFRSILRLQPVRGESALVVGAGTLGHLTAALLREQFGMDVAVSARRPESIRKIEALGCRRPADRERFRFVVEAAGTPAAVSEAFGRLDQGGRLVLVGLTGHESLPVPVDELVVGDQELVGSLGSPNVWPEVVRIVASGTVRPGALVTGEYSLANYGDAIDELSRRDSATGKLLVAPHPTTEAALAAGETVQ